MATSKGEGVDDARPAIAVLGSGSWGTALAVHLTRTGHRTVLWGRDAPQVAEMQRARCNLRYLPATTFPDALTVDGEAAVTVGAGPVATNAPGWRSIAPEAAA